jgi:hypothetical protein
MSKKDKKKDLLNDQQPEKTEHISAKEDAPEPEESATGEFDLEPISSAEMLRTEGDGLSIEPEVFQSLTGAAPANEETAAAVSETEDPIFRELAEPKLPALPKENRARLLMQSPNRIQFYWSVQHNPFQTLQRAIGNTGSYTLVAKLVNESSGREEIYPVDAEGSWWFNVEADSTYRAEIGFYAPNRPFVRIMFSNTLETPRKKPSPRQATDADWAVTALEFADVLDSTGYTQDALEVALAGDDQEKSGSATQNAFSQFVGDKAADLDGISMEEVRFALLAIASGFSLEDLREHIGAALFAVLQKNADKLTPENALAALGEHFDIAMEEIEEDEEIVGQAVFGLSLVHFPRSSKKKRTSPKTLIPKKFAPDDLGRKISPISSLR